MYYVTAAACAQVSDYIKATLVPKVEAMPPLGDLIHATQCFFLAGYCNITHCTNTIFSYPDVLMWREREQRICNIISVGKNKFEISHCIMGTLLLITNEEIYFCE